MSESRGIDVYILSLIWSDIEIILMNSSSKVQLKGPTIKFSVLRPYPKIIALTHSFAKQQPLHNYLSVVNQDFGLRKYRIKAESFEQSLRQYQWRYDCLAPVVRCLYVELLSPDCFRQTDLEIYITHLEATLSDFKQLLIHEAVYLIVESLKGYETLLERYRRVSVNEETIGVASNGEALVWINRYLENATCQEDSISTPVEVIYTVVRLIKDKSEPICRKMLAKIEDFIKRERPSFREALDYLRQFTIKNGIKLPMNLKYLLHQSRIKKRFDMIQSLKISVRAPEVGISTLENFSINIKAPKLQNCSPPSVKNSRSIPRDNGLLNTPVTPKQRKYSAGEFSVGNSLRETISSKQANSPSQSSGQKKKMPYRKWSCKVDDKVGLFSPCTKSRDRLEGSWDNNSMKVMSSQPIRSEHEEFCFGGLLKPTEGTLKSLKGSSGKSENTKAGYSHVRESNHSEVSDVSLDVETVKKLPRKCSIQFDELTIRDKYHAEVMTPTCKNKDLPSFLNTLSFFEPTFHCIPQEDTVREDGAAKNKEWANTFTSLLSKCDNNLKVSITDGKMERSSYLQDVQLQKLDSLSRQLVQSVISEDSRVMVNSNQNSLIC